VWREGETNDDERLFDTKHGIAPNVRIAFGVERGDERVEAVGFYHDVHMIGPEHVPTERAEQVPDWSLFARTRRSVKSVLRRTVCRRRKVTYI
jgi:hypothetical protein